MDEDRMDAENPLKRTPRFARAARTARTLKRARDGFAYADVAREEKITVRRVHEIVAEAIKRRETDEGATHANLELDRLGYAMRVACEKLAQGDVTAPSPFVKVINRLDRYQELAREAAPRRTRSPEDAVVLQELIRRFGRRDAQPSPPAVPAAPPPPDAADPPPPVAEPTVPPFAATSAPPPAYGPPLNFLPFVCP
jgi:hypothetical protein